VLGDPGAGQREVALGWRRDGPELVTPYLERQGIAPVGELGREIPVREDATSEFDQCPSELACIETISTLESDGTQGPGHPGKTDLLTRLQGPPRTQLVGPGYVGDEMAGESEQEGGGEPLLGESDRGFENGGERQPAEAVMECQPTIDRSRYGDAPSVAPQRHD
jgi:hypothetical protein